MRAIRLLLVAGAITLSVVPASWMTLLFLTQSIELVGSTPPYWREFLAVVLFWAGFIASLVFAKRCFAAGLGAALSPPLLLMIVLGISAGIAEEFILASDPEFHFAIGYFELAPMSWVIAGVTAAWLRGRSAAGKLVA